MSPLKLRAVIDEAKVNVYVLAAEVAVIFRLTALIVPKPEIVAVLGAVAPESVISPVIVKVTPVLMLTPVPVVELPNSPNVNDAMLLGKVVPIIGRAVPVKATTPICTISVEALWPG